MVWHLGISQAYSMRCSIAQQRRATQLFRLAHSSPAGRRHIAFTSQAQPNMAAAAPQEQGVFVLVVTGKLKDGCLPKLLANFKPLVWSGWKGRSFQIDVAPGAG